MISQACSHAADQPVITTGKACRWKLPKRSAAERGFLLQLLSHAADQPAMTAGARGGGLGLTVHALSYIQHGFQWGARGRTRTRCQPPVATNEVRGRAQFPSTSLQSCSRPARQGRRGDQTLAARSYQQGARSSFLLQVPSHVAASQRSLQVSGGSPEVSGRGALLRSKGTSGVWRQELQTRCVAERDCLLQLRSHATTSQR